MEANKETDKERKKCVDKCWDAQLNTAVGNGIHPAKNIAIEEGAVLIEE